MDDSLPHLEASELVVKVEKVSKTEQSLQMDISSNMATTLKKKQTRSKTRAYFAMYMTYMYSTTYGRRPLHLNLDLLNTKF